MGKKKSDKKAADTVDALQADLKDLPDSTMDVNRQQPVDKPPKQPKSTPPTTTPTKPSKPATPSEPLGDHSKSTLFVSSIPYTATSESLQSFFSEIGPVRSCFAVADRAQEGKNRGYGYVTFALAEDAERAVKDLKKVKFEGGRSLRIEFALRKKVVGDRKAAGLPVDPDHTPKSAKKQSTKPSREDSEIKSEDEKDDDLPPTPSSAPRHSRQTPLNMGTIEIHNLPDGVTKKQLYKKVRKYGEVKELIFPVPKDGVKSDVKEEDADEKDVEVLPGVARVTYTTGREATTAISHLHNHTYKSSTLVAKDLYALAREARKSRLIIRNLAWAAQPSHLLKCFRKFGTVSECSVPQAADGKARGFGFVQMGSVEEAEKAIEGVNGMMVVGRRVAVDWAIPKAWYDKRGEGVAEEGAAGGEAVAMDVDEKVEDGEGEKEAEGGEEEPEEGGGAEIGIFEDREGDEEEEGEDEDDGDEEDSEDDEEEDEDEEVADSDDDGVEVTYDDGEAAGKSEDEKESQATKKGQKKKAESELASKPDEKTTLFIRNLSFDTTEEELKTA
ncbi:hypothetical protein HK097_001801 [Rhizophlyctis rosea]|uniref:RRM domain-containing protein n=1 Tax=Rhizophlyctis rosea TaxID=64517 RepID=A0AAD5S6U4_9FUNG|nr:hypothetical protein HK097_001801 [Rhizophlyctis rosea]